MKKISTYAIVFTLVGTISFFGQRFLFTALQGHLEVLRDTYLFHFAASLGIVVLLQVSMGIRALREQIGLLYMVLLIFKLFVFAALFHPYLFGDQLLSASIRTALLWPVLLFLFLEVFFVTKSIKQKLG
ncbi:DUF6168 family protein [Maribacter sp. 2307ULW6-5]|uniref:DUF6168 family protein n=1 Tax=Maribacter sp. 2307ULW6-5 TaxID=3386275 RepID=UPI0039BCB97A